MVVLSDEQFNIMAFVAVCNRRDYNPTPEEVTLWLENPEPRAATYRWVASPGGEGVGSDFARHATLNLAQAMRPMIEGLNAQIAAATTAWVRNTEVLPSGTRELDTPAESVIDHLVRLTWLTSTVDPRRNCDVLQLSGLGQALYRDHEFNDALEEEVRTVVLGKDDPLAYPVLIGHLAGVGPGLLVDPYLKIGDLVHLIGSTQLTRLLINGHERNARAVAAIQVHLSTKTLPRTIEVRAAEGLHDRVVIGDNNDVFTLGSSLNGVGRKTTVFSPIPETAARSLTKEYEATWKDARLVGPLVVEDDDMTKGKS